MSLLSLLKKIFCCGSSEYALFDEESYITPHTPLLAHGSVDSQSINGGDNGTPIALPQSTYLSFHQETPPPSDPRPMTPPQNQTTPVVVNSEATVIDITPLSSPSHSPQSFAEGLKTPTKNPSNPGSTYSSPGGFAKGLFTPGKSDNSDTDSTRSSPGGFSKGLFTPGKDSYSDTGSTHSSPGGFGKGLNFSDDSDESEEEGLSKSVGQ